MDLTDILFSKPFIGSSGGGGGGSNAETATIEIAINRDTLAITSGAFPDWCTEANKDYIYGKATMHNFIIEVSEGGAAPQTIQLEDTIFGLYSIEDGENEEVYVDLAGADYTIEVASDMSYIGISLADGEGIVSATLTISLIYIPN